jgi:hypothetical protein
MDVRNIHVSANIFGVSGISSATHSFACDFYLILHWELSQAEASRVDTIERLGGLQGVEEVRKYWGSSAVFTPAIQFENARELQLILPDNEFRRYPRLDKDNPRFVKYTLQYRAVFRTDFDLKTFPFDSQQLQILIKIRRPYQLDETVRAIRSTLRACKFNLEKVERTDFHMLPNPEFVAGRSGDVSKFAISLRIQRIWLRYIVEVALSHFSLSLVACSALLFTPPDHVEYRTQVLLAIVLVSLAFNFVSSTALPMLPSFTALEIYAGFLWCFLLFMLLYVQIIGGLANSATRSSSSYSSAAHSFAGPVLAFSAGGATDTVAVERAVLATLGAGWIAVHLGVLYFIMTGLKRFASERKSNTVLHAALEMKQ